MFKSFGNYFGVDAPVVMASIIGLLFVLMIGMLPGQAAAQSGSVYGERGAQTVQQVTRGVVLQLRDVKVQPSQQAGYIGTSAGAALGGLIGVALGNNSSSAARGVLGILGATLGGVGGQAAAEHMGSGNAVEILVETQGQYNGTQVIAIVQPLPAPDVFVGQAVLVLNEGGKSRVIPAAVRSVNPAAGQFAPQSGYEPQSNQRREQTTSSFKQVNWQ